MNRNPYESTTPKVQQREVHCIICKLPGDLPGESHGASGYYDSYTEAAEALREMYKKDKSVGNTHSVTSRWV